METYNDRLRALQEKIGQENCLTNRQQELRKQKQELEKKVFDLEWKRNTEQEDVERLEQGSLANFFYRVTGKMDGMMDKEKREALEAAVRYDAAAAQLKEVEAQLRACGLALSEVRGSQQKYQKLKEEKLSVIRSSGVPEAEEIMKLEEQLAQLRDHIKEIREAQSAGSRALSMTEQIQTSLNSAENWGTYDMLGGGLMADIAKHGHIDDAQRMIERLQIQLRQYKTELADIRISADMQVNVDGFLRFADVFFDGLFSAWKVQGSISGARMQVNNVRGKVHQVQTKLEQLLRETEQKESQLQWELDQLVKNVNI